MASAPWNCTSRAWLCQPPASGGREGVAPVTPGAVASYFTVTAALAEFPALSRQLPLTGAPLLSGPL